jgi:hypothetical protein
MDIRLLDHVETCSTYSDGEVIYALIAPKILNGENVTLSFEGVSAVPSAFINAAIVRLAESASLDEVRQHLKIEDSTRQINELIKNRFDFLSSQAVLHKL